MRQIVFAIAWLAAVLVIALGAAGIVAGMDAPATAGSRPWQTARDDVLVDQELDAIAAQLQDLSAELDALGIQARGALSALVANDQSSATTALATGDALVADIRTRSQAIAQAFADLPLIGTPAAEYRIGPAVRERHARLAAALAGAGGVDEAWAGLSVGSASAARLSELLATHDETVLEAAAKGRSADYAAALAILDEADSLIADSRALRDRLRSTVDVATLDGWLDRSEAYDLALRELYDALRKSDGRVTATVRRAMTEERKARDQLPPDTRGLVVIMAEIGRGGMNGAIIEIEQARGELADALIEPEGTPAS